MSYDSNSAGASGNAADRSAVQRVVSSSQSGASNQSSRNYSPTNSHGVGTQGGQGMSFLLKIVIVMLLIVSMAAAGLFFTVHAVQSDSGSGSSSISARKELSPLNGAFTVLKAQAQAQAQAQALIHQISGGAKAGAGEGAGAVVAKKSGKEKEKEKEKEEASPSVFEDTDPQDTMVGAGAASGAGAGAGAEAVAGEKEERAGAVGEGDSEEEEDLERAAVDVVESIRTLKYTDHVVIETDSRAQELVKQAQAALYKLLVKRYGAGPIYVEMGVILPAYLAAATTTTATTATTAGKGKGAGAGADSINPSLRSADNQKPVVEKILIEMAPIDVVPYSVYFFLENIVKPFQGGDFHRNAGHVLQAMLHRDHKLLDLQTEKRGKDVFAWQEYNPLYPHKQYTLGYAGRPSNAQAMYISTIDNTRNHGPASQGSKSEADSIIGRLANKESVAIAKRMQKQKGGAKGSGFISNQGDFIHIAYLKIVTK